MMNIIENQLIESVVYNFISTLQNANNAFITSAPGEVLPPTPPINPDEITTKLNDQFKTYLRFKAEAKSVAGMPNQFYVSYKDNLKNPHTLYFEV